MRDGRNGGGRAIALALSFALACTYEVHSDYTSEGCAPGSTGCPCAEDGGCDGALECVDGSCRPGAGGSVPSTGTSTTSDGAGSTAAASTGAPDTTAGFGTGAGATTGCEFICDTDQPGTEFLCDVFAQDCSEGQKCAAYDMDGDGAWDSTKCVDVMGDGQHGDPCTAEAGATGVDDCDVGVMCWNLNEDGVGTCVALCTGTPENPSCEPDATYCAITSIGALNLCLPGCSPLDQDCPDGEACIGDPNGDGFICVLDASNGMAPEGTPCEYANVCNPGLICVDPALYPSPACALEEGCCAPFCDLNLGDEECQGLSVEDAVCVAYHEPDPGPPGFENVGVCGAP